MFHSWRPHQWWCARTIYKHWCVTASESTVLQQLVCSQTDLPLSRLPRVLLVCLWTTATSSLGLSSVKLGLGPSSQPVSICQGVAKSKTDMCTFTCPNPLGRCLYLRAGRQGTREPTEATHMGHLEGLGNVLQPCWSRFAQKSRGSWTSTSSNKTPRNAGFIAVRVT